MRLLPFRRPGALALEASFWGQAFAESKPEACELKDGVAIVRISGPLTQHREWFFDSYDAIRARVDEALASSCTAVVLRIDSPGGDAAGCFETARSLAAAAAAAGKRLVAYADGCTSSAAYALACAADAIYVGETSRVGSIGVITVAVDQSAMDRQIGLTFSVIASGERKADGHPHVPISAEAVEAIQVQVNELAEIFFAHVASRRPLSVEEIRGQQAGTFIGASAVEARLADGVATFDELLAMVASGEATSRPRAAAAEGNGMKFEELLAALTKAAEGDGEDADKAKKMLKSIQAEDEKSDDKAEDEEAPPSSKKDDKAEDEESDDKAEDEGDEKKDKASATAPAIDLAATVQKLSAELAAISRQKAANERRDLLTSRPDLAPELVKVLKKAPLATVRDIVKSLPKPAKKDPAAALKAAPTAGADQTGNVLAGPTRASAQAAELDAAFGLTAAPATIRREGATVTFGAMTPEEARRYAASKQKKETV